MANFRTTSDILDGVLRRCGEITSDVGVSPRATAALLYLNQIHQTIISGGNELNLDVDEPWIWAKARQPIVIQINPSVTSGTVGFIQGSVTGTFSSAPQVNGSNASLENWMIQPSGFPDIYRISSHTSGSTSFSIDAPYPQTTNSALSFLAYQIDYDLVTSTINIDQYCDKLDFSEDSGNTTLTATLTHGGSTPSALATAVGTALTSASVAGNTYTGSYDSIQRLFTFVSNGLKSSQFWISGAGSNYYRSGWTELGFDFTTQAGALTYTSVYPLSSIVRLSQPARIYYGSQFYQGQGDGQVGALDTVAFDQQYPLISIKMGAPDAFCILQENGKGSLKIRFNKYLSATQNMRCEFDFIPEPKDLFQNSASIPLIPKQYRKVLEFGASHYVCTDKSDSRAQNYLNVSQASLGAMLRANRRELLRTGKGFGTIWARPDLMPSKKRWLRGNDYGYSVGS